MTQIRKKEKIYSRKSGGKQKLLNFKVELVDKFIMSFFEKGILKEEEEKHTKIRNEQGVTTNI